MLTKHQSRGPRQSKRQSQLSPKKTRTRIKTSPADLACTHLVVSIFQQDSVVVAKTSIKWLMGTKASVIVYRTCSKTSSQNKRKPYLNQAPARPSHLWLKLRSSKMAKKTNLLIRHLWLARSIKLSLSSLVLLSRCQSTDSHSHKACQPNTPCYPRAPTIRTNSNHPHTSNRATWTQNQLLQFSLSRRQQRIVVSSSTRWSWVRGHFRQKET